MAESEAPADQVRSVVATTIEQAHGAIADYFQFVEKSRTTFQFTLPVNADTISCCAS